MLFRSKSFDYYAGLPLLYTSSGYVDGSGLNARFNTISGLAVDATDHLYVADQLNRRIRLVSPSAVVTTFAGSGNSGSADGTGTAASFVAPFGVALDASGNVYVSDKDAHMIRKIDRNGVVTTLAGTTGVGTRIYRSRVEALARAESPAIVVEPISDTAQENTSLPTLDWSLTVRIAVIVRGTAPDQLADATIQ